MTEVAVVLAAVAVVAVLAVVLRRLKQPAQEEGRADELPDDRSERFYGQVSGRPAGPDAEDAAPGGEPDGRDG